MIGDYFVVDNINNQTYVFKLDGARIKTTKQTGAFSFQTVDYDISHYLPVTSDVKLIELVEKINSLPRINGKLHGIIKILGRTEKEEFTPHNLTKLIEELSNSKEKYQKEVLEMMNYFARLNVTQIVTPLRRLADFIEDDLKTTDPRYGGAIFDKAVEIDKENKKMTNSPKTAKKSIFMFIAIPVILILIGIVVYQAYEMGAFDNIGNMFGGSFGGMNDEQIMSKYPNGPSLKAAVDSGQIDYDSLSPKVKAIYDSVQTPTTAP